MYDETPTDRSTDFPVDCNNEDHVKGIRYKVHQRLRLDRFCLKVDMWVEYIIYSRFSSRSLIVLSAIRDEDVYLVCEYV